MTKTTISDEKCPQCKPDSMEKLNQQAEGNVSWFKCEQCQTWIHAICDEIDEIQVKNIKTFHCQICRTKGFEIEKYDTDSCSQNIDENHQMVEIDKNNA